MRAVRSRIALRLFSFVLFAAGQTAVAQADPQTTQTQPAPPPADPGIAPANHVEGDVLPPKLLTGVKAQYTEKARKAGLKGTVLVNLTVDSNGLPQNVHVLRGLGMGLDENAVAAAKQYRFQPATQNGKPVDLEVNLRVNFHITSFPMLIYKVDPVIPGKARGFDGIVLVNLIVDAKGMPQNVHVLRGVGTEIDESAVDAVKQYRFQPATEDGKPVSVQLNVEVNFKP